MKLIIRFMLVAFASAFVALWLAVRYPTPEGMRRADEIGQSFQRWVAAALDEPS